MEEPRDCQLNISTTLERNSVQIIPSNFKEFKVLFCSKDMNNINRFPTGSIITIFY